MKILPIVFLGLILSGCLKPKQTIHHHFVSVGIKDLPLILLDQDTGKICYAGDPTGPSAYLDWYGTNVGKITEKAPYYCSDVTEETQ
jgi:hypothetical protein